MPTLTPKGVEILRHVKAHILEEPKRLNMSTWFVLGSDIDKFNDRYNKVIGAVDFAPCGTAACIAGWATFLYTPEKLEPKSDNVDARYYASILLTGHRDYLAVRDLFYVDEWDSPYAWRYRYAKTVKEKAQVAADYIDHYIKTRGPVEATCDAEERTAEPVGV